MGPYPFEIFGIQPKMRSGRRFEIKINVYSLVRLQTAIANQAFENGALCARLVQKIGLDTQ